MSKRLKKPKKLVKPKNKEAVLSEGVNSESEEQDISDKQTIKPKREKKVGVGTQKEIIKTTTKSVTNKIAENLDNKQSGRNKEDIQDHTEENYVKPKPVTKKRGQAKPNNESEDKNKIAIKSDKKNKEDNQVQIEESYAKSKPVNKGKVKPNNDSEGEPPKVQDEKAKEKSIKVPKNKKEAKITEEIDKTTNTEKANEKLVKKTKPTSKIVENKENETSNKVDGDAEEIPVTRKRVPRKNNAEQVEKGVLSDHTNEEPIKKKTGRPKATENPAVEPKKNEKTGKKAKANEVEKPKDSKKTQQARAKKVTETQPMATEEVLPKRSTRNKKV